MSFNPDPVGKMGPGGSTKAPSAPVENVSFANPYACYAEVDAATGRLVIGGADFRIGNRTHASSVLQFDPEQGSIARGLSFDDVATKAAESVLVALQSIPTIVENVVGFLASGGVDDFAEPDAAKTLVIFLEQALSVQGLSEGTPAAIQGLLATLKASLPPEVTTSSNEARAEAHDRYVAVFSGLGTFNGASSSLEKVYETGMLYRLLEFQDGSILIPVERSTGTRGESEVQGTDLSEFAIAVTIGDDTIVLTDPVLLSALADALAQKDGPMRGWASTRSGPPAGLYVPLEEAATLIKGRVEALVGKGDSETFLEQLSREYVGKLGKYLAGETIDFYFENGNVTISEVEQPGVTRSLGDVKAVAFTVRPGATSATSGNNKLSELELLARETDGTQLTVHSAAAIAVMAKVLEGTPAGVAAKTLAESAAMGDAPGAHSSDAFSNE